MSAAESATLVVEDKTSETPGGDINAQLESRDPKTIMNSTFKDEEMEKKASASAPTTEEEVRDIDTVVYDNASIIKNPKNFFDEFDSIRKESASTEVPNFMSTPKKEACRGGCYDKLNKAVDRTTDMIEMLITTLDSHSKSMSGNKTGVDEGHDYFLPPTAKRKTKVAVEIKCTFLKIMDINTVGQKFGAEIFVQAKWEEPQLKNKTVQDYKTFIEDHKTEEFIPWEPQLTIVNTEGSLEINKKTYDVKFQVPGRRYPVVLQLWRFKGTFKETLELQHFPFDVQDLTISISAERSNEELELIEDRKSMCSINTSAFMDIQEWDIFQHVETFQNVTTVEYCSATVHPILHVQCRVARQVGYFAWNVVFIVILMFCTSFATFTIEPSSPDRLISTITLFLTVVAFKLVVQQSLPTISYLTYLDMYILAAMIYLTVQSGQNAVVAEMSRAGNDNLLKAIDRFTMLAMAILCIIAHIVFIMFIGRTAQKRKRIMQKKDKIYKWDYFVPGDVSGLHRIANFKECRKKNFLRTFGRLPYENEHWRHTDLPNTSSKKVRSY